MLHACLILIEEVKGDKDSISTSEAAKLESKGCYSMFNCVLTVFCALVMLLFLIVVIFSCGLL